MYRITLLLLLCAFIAGCAAKPYMKKEEARPGEKKEALPEVQKPAEEQGVRATLIHSGIMMSSPGILTGELKIVPQSSEVYVMAYVEPAGQQPYLQVRYGNDTGYLSLDNFRMDDTLKRFIESRQEEIYRRNLETMKLIEDEQNKIEARKVWVISMSAPVLSSPSMGSSLVGTLQRGSEAFVQGEADGWYRIYFNGPRIDYESGDYDYVADIARIYKDVPALESSYSEGWIQDGMVSDTEIEGVSGADRRRQEFVQEHPGLNQILKDAILNGEIIIGMTMDMVAASWGPADEVERPRLAFESNEEWVYGNTRLYFENGTLTEWQEFEQ